MSKSLNKCLILGNVGNDPEVRTTGGGTKVAEFSVATNRKWTDRSGQAQEKTEWHRVIAWTALADIAEQYLKKGDRVYVEGEIQYRSYENKEGQTVYVTEINARDLIMLGGRDGEARKPAAATASAPASYDDFQPPSLDDDSDLPF